MSLRNIFVLVSAAVLALLTGCAAPLAHPLLNPMDTPSMVEQQVRLGVVYDVKEIDGQAPATGYKGAVTGGVTGGFVGSMLSSSTFVRLATAAAGAAVGHEYDKPSTKAMPSVEITIRLENQTLVAITQAKSDKVAFKKGDTVRIVGAGKSARVTPA